MTAFPQLVGSDSPLNVAGTFGSSSILDFTVTNTTKQDSDSNYNRLRSAFGAWECTLSNSLGSQTETTFISDSCKLIPVEPALYL